MFIFSIAVVSFIIFHFLELLTLKENPLWLTAKLGSNQFVKCTPLLHELHRTFIAARCPS